MQTAAFTNDLGDTFNLDGISEKVAAAQTALYALINRSDLPKEVTIALLSIHGDLGGVVYDTMTAKEVAQ